MVQGKLGILHSFLNYINGNIIVIQMNSFNYVSKVIRKYLFARKAFYKNKIQPALYFSDIPYLD